MKRHCASSWLLTKIIINIFEHFTRSLYRPYIPEHYLGSNDAISCDKHGTAYSKLQVKLFLILVPSFYSL